MRLETAFTEFAYSKDHTPASRVWYRARLGAFMQWASAQGVTEIEQITAPLVRRYIDQRRTEPSHTGRPLSSYTLHGHVRAIRAWLHWAVNEDLMDEKTVRRIALPQREQKVLAILTPQHIDRLFAACDDSETPEYVARDRAILALLVDTGLRANELCTLCLADVHFTSDEAYVLLHGKGRKEREVPLGRRSRQYLHRYLHRARPRTHEPRVFIAKGGPPFTPGGVDRLLYRLRDRAGRHHFAGIRVSAHTFRHSYAVRCLEAGMDIYRLSRLMGHSTVQVTEGYLKAVSMRKLRSGAMSVLDTM